MSHLQPFGDGIWTCEGPRVRMLSIPFSTRMTIVEVEPGALWVHSPVEPSRDRQAAIDALGAVKYVIAPNKIHSLGLAPWKSRYPSAEVWVSPGFCERHPEAEVDHVIGVHTPCAWSAEIEALHFRGSLFLDEVVFYHGRSRTLILTDLVQRHDLAQESWFWRIVKRAAGVLGPRGGTSRDLRSTFLDRDAARASAEAMLRWNFDRVVISHGACITRHARPAIETAFGWALN